VPERSEASEAAMSWQADVVERLCDYKAAGVPFDEAWRQAMIDCPPRGRDMGPERPSLFDRDTSQVAFFRRAADDAWHGRKPALQGFHPSLLLEVSGVTHGRRGRSRAPMLNASAS
jgi:hypothetical protein